MLKGGGGADGRSPPVPLATRLLLGQYMNNRQIIVSMLEGFSVNHEGEGEPLAESKVQTEPKISLNQWIKQERLIADSV